MNYKLSSVSMAIAIVFTTTVISVNSVAATRHNETNDQLILGKDGKYHNRVDSRKTVNNVQRDRRTDVTIHKKTTINTVQRDNRVAVHKNTTIIVPQNHRRDYRHGNTNIIIYRPYGHWYNGYGSYRNDNDAYKWLAFTAITLKLLDNLNEQQQREHEAAQIRATTAPINQPIVWNDNGATGTVVATHDGRGADGRYCREFQQTITVGGKTEKAYGNACQNPDGSWQMVTN